MNGRTPLVAANWKMNNTIAETEAFLDEFAAAAESIEGVEIVLAPPFTALAAASARLGGANVRLASQNVHSEESGAFTGEISRPMLAELGVWGAIVGHSERRQLFGETDPELARKVAALSGSEIVPILCVGETESERDSDQTEAVLERQLTADLAAVAGGLGELVVAYEPIWAIGTGRTATPEQAQDACAHVRSVLAGLDGPGAERVRVLYGGSVKPQNAAELFACPDIDGGLVGGASLDPADFLAICEAAAPASP